MIKKFLGFTFGNFEGWKYLRWIGKQGRKPYPLDEPKTLISFNEGWEKWPLKLTFTIKRDRSFYASFGFNWGTWLEPGYRSYSFLVSYVLGELEFEFSRYPNAAFPLGDWKTKVSLDERGKYCIRENPSFALECSLANGLLNSLI